MDDNASIVQRLDALETEVVRLRADLEHVMAQTYVKRKKTPPGPEAQPLKEPIWNGAEQSGCPVKR